jgi:hypothetical protein
MQEQTPEAVRISVALTLSNSLHILQKDLDYRVNTV